MGGLVRLSSRVVWLVVTTYVQRTVSGLASLRCAGTSVLRPSVIAGKDQSSISVPPCHMHGALRMRCVTCHKACNVVCGLPEAYNDNQPVRIVALQCVHTDCINVVRYTLHTPSGCMLTNRCVLTSHYCMVRSTGARLAGACGLRSSRTIGLRCFAVAATQVPHASSMLR